MIVGFGSILSLNLIESGFGLLLSLIWTLTAGVAITGLLLPVNGVRKRIRNAKVARLETCREDLRRAQASLDASGADEELTRVANLLAIRQNLSEIREWPFDASTLRRMVLYLLVPLASWSGGALVERWIDAALE